MRNNGENPCRAELGNGTVIQISAVPRPNTDTGDDADARRWKSEKRFSQGIVAHFVVSAPILFPYLCSLYAAC